MTDYCPMIAFCERRVRAQSFKEQQAGHLQESKLSPDSSAYMRASMSATICGVLPRPASVFRGDTLDMDRASAYARAYPVLLLVIISHFTTLNEETVPILRLCWLSPHGNVTGYPPTGGGALRGAIPALRHLCPFG